MKLNIKKLNFIVITRLCMLNIHSCSFIELTVNHSNKFKIFNIFNESCLLLCSHIIIFALFFINNVFIFLVLSLFEKIFNL